MMIDMDHVSGLIRAAVEAKILPRFRNLAAGEVAQKGPNDPVTIADIEAEEMLSRLLLEAYPGTLVVGEELVSREPATLDALLGDTPVWVIDPVDGTMNFADGQPGIRDDPGLCRRRARPRPAGFTTRSTTSPSQHCSAAVPGATAGGWKWIRRRR